MNKNNNKMDLLGNAPVPQALMALGIPIMIGMLINALYNLVDAYFIGGLGESQMGAISIAFPLGQVVVGLGLMFGNGAASYLSRLLGRGDREAASKVASTALYSSVCIGAVIIIGTAIFLKPILTMLGATDTIMPYALSYGRIYVISCIFNVFNVTMNNIVASEGAAKTTMCALLLGAVLNIGLDPIFIYTLDMGVAGAAIATAISQMASTLVYLIYALQKKSAFTFSIKEFCPSKQIITEILKIGIPTLTFQLLTSLSIAFINREANIYGDAVIAGMGAVTRIILRFSLDDTVDICLLQKHVIFTVNTGNDIVIHGNHTFFQRITIIHIRSATSHQKIIRSKSANINPYDFRNLTDFHHPRHHGCIILRKRHYILYTEVIDFIVEAQFLHLPVPFEIAFISLTKLCKMLRRKPNRKFHLNDILRLDLAFLLQLHCNGK